MIYPEQIYQSKLPVSMNYSIRIVHMGGGGELIKVKVDKIQHEDWCPEDLVYYTIIGGEWNKDVGKTEYSYFLRDYNLISETIPEYIKEKLFFV